MEHLSMKTLVIDVGGSHVKVSFGRPKEVLKLPSGPHLTARRMVTAVQKAIANRRYDNVSIGYPGPVENGRPSREPKNLGGGWVRFNYEKAFGKPVRVVNDAAMQAIGSYEGGRMLFLGLGTGLGSALVADGVVEPLELAHLPYRKKKTYEDYVGLRGFVRMGRKKWEHHVAKVVDLLKHAMQADYVVLGGGQTRFLKAVPPGARIGKNENAILGGTRLWRDVGRRGARISVRSIRRPPRHAPGPADRS
jgi:polyphosphate glucokinase